MKSVVIYQYCNNSGAMIMFLLYAAKLTYFFQIKKATVK